MVKLSSSLLSLTLVTSVALAAPHHYYDRDILERDLDEEFSGREYRLDAFANLAARDPSFLGGLENAVKDVGKVAVNGLHVAEKIADNPYVQAASSVLPGGPAIVTAEKVIGAIGKVERMAEKARGAGQKIQKFEGAVRKSKTFNNAINTAERKVGGLRHLGGAAAALGKASVRTIGRAKQVASSARRHHRRDLEDDEELSRRDLDAEELWEREYDGFLADRDFFDDLD